MNAADYYPAGAYYDPNAPYNQAEVPERDFDVVCSQSLSRTAVVTTNNYIPGASGVDYETDDEGGCYASSWHDEDDTSDTDWKQEYDENGYYTPLQLIQLFKETLKNQLDSWNGMEDTPAGKKEIQKIEHLIDECDCWTEDELEIFED